MIGPCRHYNRPRTSRGFSFEGSYPVWYPMGPTVRVRCGVRSPSIDTGSYWGSRSPTPRGYPTYPTFFFYYC